jgi:hypothetical protein
VHSKEINHRCPQRKVIQINRQQPNKTLKKIKPFGNVVSSFPPDFGEKIASGEPMIIIPPIRDD